MRLSCSLATAACFASTALGAATVTLTGSDGKLEMLKDDGTPVCMSTLDLEKLLGLQARVVALEASGGKTIVRSSGSQEACTNGNKGEIYFDDTQGAFLGCTGTVWKKLDHAPCLKTVDLLDETKHEFSADSQYPSQPIWAPRFVANKHASTSSGEWTTQCFQSVSVAGAHWLKVDFGKMETITSFGVHGYAGGSHNPAGNWQLQGSNDDSNWDTVWQGPSNLWTVGTAPSYPPPTTIDVSSPSSYRFYRIYSARYFFILITRKINYTSTHTHTRTRTRTQTQHDQQLSPRLLLGYVRVQGRHVC